MTADTVGGIWTYALNLAAGLAEQGVATVLLLLGPPADAAQRAAAAAVPGLELRESNLPLDWLAETPEAVAAATRALADWVAREGVDLLHLNNPALAAGTRFGVPVVGLCHSCLATWWHSMRRGPMPADFAWRSRLLAAGYAASDMLVAPTAAFAAATAAAYALPRLPRVVHNGCAAPRAAAIAQAGFAFTAGRLWDEGKDVATLDRAAAQLGWPVLAAGSVAGPNGACVALQHLRLLGRLDAEAMAAVLAQGPVFVSAARYEPFGLAVLEAAQAGCALVLSDIPSFRELWDGAALFVPPGDGRAFATAIGDLLQDRERRAASCAASRERARRYGRGTMARDMLRIYAELLQAPAAAAAGEAA
ncbi:glycosyltransferase family 4 protein [Siccirubricoccus phaeus]|uniref:glycosyltransferase family 4 protein n=1 Tax=Siccirubricoccus phaeus TaxID=2595053 RepID=UPI0011F3B509|nr:glycosyltransferase [Siccirubricoccus phaeus]